MGEVFSIVGWSLSLGAKFYRVVPIMTLIIVLLTLVAQIASLLSFFLPLKIIILLGSEGMPHYFPSSFSQISRDSLIGLLSAATLGIFLLSLLANKLIDIVTDSAVVKLLSRSHKMVLFENQNDIAANGYRRYSSALAGGVFVPLAMLALGWFYPSMAMVIGGYLILVVFLCLGFYHFSDFCNDYLKRKLSAALAFAGNVGFFLVFAFLVLEFIFFSPPSFIVAIISLIASRQIFGRATATAVSISGLAKQRPKLDALFFHGKVFHTQPAKLGRDNLFGILMPEQRMRWVPPILKETGIAGEKLSKLETVWLESSQPNMPHILVFNPEFQDQYYLIKLFDMKRKAVAQHEGTLATESSYQLPMAELILLTEVDGFPCHVYKLPLGKFLNSKECNARISELNGKFFTVSLSDRLVNRYRRSRPLLNDRLSCELLERLYVACNQRGDVLVVAEVVERLAEIQSVLRDLPVGLVNPGVKSFVWSAIQDQSLLVLNWEKWSLEPFGAGWPVGGRGMKELIEHIELAAKQNNELLKVKPEAVQLAALVFELERLMTKQQFLPALGLLPRIINKLNRLQAKKLEE